jgi:hypothetical protein
VLLLPLHHDGLARHVYSFPSGFGMNQKWMQLNSFPEYEDHRLLTPKLESTQSGGIQWTHSGGPIP